MEMRRSFAPAAVVAVIMVAALFAGCIGDEETPPPDEPEALFTGPGEAWVDELVVFDASASSDDKDKFDVLNFSWDMGDGTLIWGKPFISGGVVTPNHTYEREGKYRVDLSVIDTWGNAGHANMTIVVRYQLNMTVNARGTWNSEDALNNTTFFNLTVKNVWTGQFDVPRVQMRMLNDTGGHIDPRATSGDTVPANLTSGQSFTVQVHFVVPPTFEPIVLRLCDELVVDLADGT
jgi:hypothetical protein